MQGNHTSRPAVPLGANDHFDEILRLLKQQRELLARWPYSGEQIAKDRELSVRIRHLVDRLRIPDSAPKTER
jgi:hypothetical protein